MTTQLTLHTKAAAAPNQFETYWTTGRKQGLITTTLDLGEMPDAAIAAELSALHYLLSYKDVLGNARAGNAMSIQVTFGAIRKLAQGTSNKGYLVPHARFLLSRYADAELSVSKSDDWIRPLCAQNRSEALTVREPLAEVIEVAGIGKVGLSTHIIDRMMGRANFSSISAAWRYLCRVLGSNQVSEVALPPEIARQKAAKHGSVGRHLRVGSEPWRFVLGDGDRRHGCTLPMLLTAYVRA